MTQKKINNKYLHPFHLVDPSPWPILTAFSALITVCGLVAFFHGHPQGTFILKRGFLLLVYLSFNWWHDVIREAVIEGQHTSNVQTGLRLGMILFICSEVMFFFAFFWAFFHASINPDISIGGVWPPVFLETISPWALPLLNTMILLTSGFSVTAAHNAIIWGKRYEALAFLAITCYLAVIFTMYQAKEYQELPFTIADGVYGSTFFMTTGFHGFHVLIGTCFLIVGYLRVFKGEFTRHHHIGFEAAAYYWHFVDIVWLLLFVSIYWWGS
jgi:heme/copper-type cytochrome/quinol oxidase subunit 3